MSWRTVVISKRCKLDLKMGFMIVRSEEISRIFLDEIAILILENPAVSMTTVLLNALVERKVRVVFCDERHLPLAELVPYSAHYSSPSRLQEQISWDVDRKGMVWTAIIAEKLARQAEFMEDLGLLRETELIRSYLDSLEIFDPTHREAHAAKVYFNALFGKDFSRSDDNVLNSALNYGYAVILAAVSREIAAGGYSAQLGLCHRGAFNAFNLSSDLMEPFRVLVDREVVALSPAAFGTEEKHSLAAILEREVLIDDSRQTALNAIRIYVRSVFDALHAGNASLVKSWHPV
ncbi:MAG: type II CRISPR-associated endonuclease Cas1 [Desulfovibrionaceae bacterium]|nr:type II CRISPR-associated endonuclease Cas1 [Desulfovibrionaceae bacterium]